MVTRNMSLKNAQEMVDKNVQQVQGIGRRAVLAYAGLWGMAYDRARTFVDKAEERGEELETQAADEIRSSFEQAQQRLDQVQSRMRRNFRRAENEVEEEVETRMERVLRRLNVPDRARITELNAKIDAVSREIDQVKAARVEMMAEAAQPWPKYDQMTAKEVVARLDRLTIDELVEVKQYEIAHDNRVTVLREVDARIEAMPIVHYDALTVDQIEPLLNTLDAEELAYLAKYESAHENRVTLLRAIEDQMEERQEVVA